MFILLGYELSPNSHQSRGIINDPHIINLGRYCRSYIRGDGISLAIIMIVGSITDKRVSLSFSLSLSLSFGEHRSRIDISTLS